MSERRPPIWNLSDLYASADDPAIQETLKRQSERAAGFAAKYQGRINDTRLIPEIFLNAIREYEVILQELEKPLDYANLLFSADTSVHRHGALLQSVREKHSQAVIKLLFFELELAQVPDDRMERLLSHDCLRPYAHWVRTVRLFREHRLSEGEERLLEEKANTGRRAFTRFFEQIISNIVFRITRGGRDEELSFPEIVALQRDPDRGVRQASAAAMTEGFLSRSRDLTYVFNTLVQDKATDDRLRAYTFPEEERHLSNELSPDVVETVVSVVERHYPMVAGYYHLKREILGFDHLAHYDRYAPLFESRAEISFDRAREIVLSSLGGFSGEMKQVAARFFDGEWIDAAMRPGKSPGAFCSYVTPDLHPYVLMNYTSRLDDVMTLGHEIGHGIHSCLASEHGYLSFAPSLPVAELASTFGQMLVFDSLRGETNREESLALYAETIEDAMATIFRQAAMYRFEQEVHALRRSKGELDSEEISAVWQRRLQETFGDSLTLGDEHRFWWMPISHFVNWPFYVYAYVFGQLLVMSLYATYRREGESFVPKYLSLLKAGGSVSPEEMLSDVGINIRDEQFWVAGLDVLSGLIDEFEDLYRGG